MQGSQLLKVKCVRISPNFAAPMTRVLFTRVASGVLKKSQVSWYLIGSW